MYIFLIFRNILLVASSNSAELAVLGFTPPDSWTQWIISDSSRAELPLSTDHQETLPIGLSLDISNTKPYPWDESTIAPCPYVLMLSHQGILCVFDIINLKNVPPICTPPDPIEDLSGLNQFIAKPTSMTLMFYLHIQQLDIFRFQIWYQQKHKKLNLNLRPSSHLQKLRRKLQMNYQLDRN